MSIDQDLLNHFASEDTASNSLGKYAQDQEAMAEKQNTEDVLSQFEPEEGDTIAEPEKQDILSRISKEYEKNGMVNEGMALDVTKGVATGMLSAIEQTANFALDAGNAVEGMIQKMGYGSGGMIPDDAQINVIEKTFGEPTNNLEHAARIFGQYMAPFGLVSKLSKAKGIVGGIKNVGVASGISALIQDPEDQRLSNLVQANPALANPITEFLAQDNDDPRLLSRVKTAIEAATVDLATLGIAEAGQALFRGIRATKNLRKVRELEKISEADAVPTGSVIDEASIQKNETRINSEFEDQAAKASKAEAPKGEGQAKPKVSGEELKKEVAPKVPKNPPPTPEEMATLRKAEEFGTSAQTMPELVKELKASGRAFTANDLHKIAKRGVVDDTANLKMAEKIMAQEGKVDELLNRKFGTALNQEERTAMKLDYMKKQLELDSMIAAKNIDEMSEAELAVVQERINNMMALDASIEAASSESGRALRSSQMYPGVLSGSDDALKLKKAKEYLKLHGGTESVKETIRQLKQIQEHGLSTFDYFRHKSASIRTKAADAAFEMWVNNVLSGPSTILLTNPISNIVSQGLAVAEAGTASLIGKMVGRGTVDGEVAAMFSGFIDAFWDSFTAAKTVFNGKTQLPKEASKFVFNRRKAISSESFGLDPMSMYGKFVDVMGHLWNTPTRILTAQDVFFNMMNQKARLYQLSHRQAMSKGLVPGSKEYEAAVTFFKKNPNAGMIKEAERFGQELTLTTPLSRELGFGPMSITGESVQKLQQFMEKVPLGRYAGAFMRVSTNLADRTIQRTPLSFLRPETRRILFSGNAARVQEEIAKMTVGTGVLFGGGLLAHQGFITGSGPDDPKMKRALRSSGWQPDSIRLPGGGYMPLKNLGVGGVLLKISADLAEVIGRIDSDDENSHLSDELILAGSTILMSSMTPEYLARGVPDFFTFVKDMGEGRISPEDIANSAAKFSTGFVPMSGFVRQAGQLIDPESRDTRVDNRDASMIMKTWERVKHEWLETAGLSGYAGLPPELNIFGEEVYSPMGVGDSIKSAIFSNKRDPNDPVVKELIRLDSTGEVIHMESPNQEALSIRMPERVKRKGIGIGQGVTVPVKLSPKEYHDYVKLSAGLKVGYLKVPGPTLKEALKQVIDMPSYKDGTEDMKKIMIKKVVSGYKAQAWQLMMMRPDIQEEVNSRRNERVKSLFGVEF